MSGWFAAQIVHTGRLPLFCFFCAFLVSFCFIRLSVRLIRAQVRWWPGNISRGDTHVHHMVFGVIFMVIAGVAAIAPPAHSADWRAGSAALFGIGTALVLDEFALILHLRDVYWSSAGRVSIDAVLIAAGITALLLLGASPAGVSDVADYRHLPGGAAALVSLVLTLVLLFACAAVTLLKGKIWTGLIGLFLPFPVRRGRAAARTAALALGPLALPGQAPQARQGRPARDPHPPAGDRSRLRSAPTLAARCS